jgi:hypothetical protein
MEDINKNSTTSSTEKTQTGSDRVIMGGGTGKSAVTAALFNAGKETTGAPVDPSEAARYAETKKITADLGTEALTLSGISANSGEKPGFDQAGFDAYAADRPNHESAFETAQNQPQGTPPQPPVGPAPGPNA